MDTQEEKQEPEESLSTFSVENILNSLVSAALLSPDTPPPPPSTIDQKEENNNRNITVPSMILSTNDGETVDISLLVMLVNQLNVKLATQEIQLESVQKHVKELQYNRRILSSRVEELEKREKVRELCDNMSREMSKHFIQNID